MRKILILAACLHLGACPLMYSANLRNETDGTAEFVWKPDSIAAATVGKKETAEMSWYVKCLTVNEATRSRSFQIPEILPKGVRTSGAFIPKITFDVVLNNEGLFFVSKKGELVAIESAGKCNDHQPLSTTITI